MTSRELVTALFVAVVAVVAVSGCKDEKLPAFIIFKEGNGQMYGIAVDKDGTRYLVKPDMIWKCDGSNQHCVQQAKACPTCSVCDCRRVDCTKWCLKGPVIELQESGPVPVPVPGGDPATQPPPTAPK